MKIRSILLALSMSCAFVAQAATNITPAPEEGDFLYGLAMYWDFNNGSTDYQTTTGLTFGVGTNISADNQIATGGVENTGYISSWVGNSKIDFYNNFNSSGISASAFTISFKVRNLTADYRSMVSFNLGDTQYQLQTTNPSDNGTGVNTIVLYGTAGLTTGADTKSTVRGTEWANVVITSDGTSLSLYVNDMMATSGITLAETDTLKNFQLASTWGDSSRASSADYDDLAIWNRTLSADEISYLTAGGAVPEPTTATLSLLALAGLAARRRRK